jgi:hypothetical protein
MGLKLREHHYRKLDCFCRIIEKLTEITQHLLARGSQLKLTFIGQG